jgi:hypothetical protein
MDFVQLPVFVEKLMKMVAVGLLIVEMIAAQ